MAEELILETIQDGNHAGQLKNPTHEDMAVIGERAFIMANYYACLVSDVIHGLQ